MLRTKKKKSNAISRPGPPPPGWEYVSLPNFSDLTDRQFETIRKGIKIDNKAPSFLKKCTDANRDLMKCLSMNDKWGISIRLGPVIIKNMIGQGSGGKVYIANTNIIDKEHNTVESKVVAVKIMEMRISDIKDKDLIIDAYERELTYSIAMSNQGIAPEFFGGFYIEGRFNTYTFVFIMEKYDDDLNNYISKIAIKENNFDKVSEIIKQISHILNKQVYNSSLICNDIKPENFVINYKNKIDIRMIDFDDMFCQINEISNACRHLLFILLMTLMSCGLQRIKMNKSEQYKREYKNFVIQAFKECISGSPLDHITDYAIEQLMRDEQRFLVQNIIHYWKKLGSVYEVSREQLVNKKTLKEFIYDGLYRKY